MQLIACNVSVIRFQLLIGIQIITSTVLNNWLPDDIESQSLKKRGRIHQYL